MVEFGDAAYGGFECAGDVLLSETWGCGYREGWVEILREGLFGYWDGLGMVGRMKDTGLSFLQSMDTWLLLGVV